MINIPLFCNICPQEPEFSDVSHLLTHVASKGHLSQHNKAKLRAHQDEVVREKLQAYDRWYYRHQIERLLSERMIAKDSKDSSTRSRASKTKPRNKAVTKDTQPRKRRPKETKHTEQEQSNIKHEGSIDPQLSQTLFPPCTPDTAASTFTEPSLTTVDQNQSPSPSIFTVTNHQINVLNQPYHHHTNRAPIPLMSSWQEPGSSSKMGSAGTQMNTNGAAYLHQSNDTDDEDDYFQTFLRSPTRTAYPDPSEVIGNTGAHSGLSVDSSFGVKEDDMELEPKVEPSKKVTTVPQSPVLRGVKWPGMSIFDSANIEAQRLRNQKKTEDIIEQMEQNSISVEQLERIYWPDGSLKLQREITGEVTSSPLRDPTPPPKPPRRRRPKASKSILADKSTNRPSSNKKLERRKVSNRAQALDLRSTSREALASMNSPHLSYPRSAFMTYNPPTEEDVERQLTTGKCLDQQSRGFGVFKDHKEDWRGSRSESTEGTNANVFTLASTSSTEPEVMSTSTINVHPNPRPCAPLQIASRHGLPYQIEPKSKESRSHFTYENDENIEPILHNNGRITHQPASLNPPRSTQRYFSVTGDQAPQFFNYMPPGMDFGGVTEPRCFGVTPNPLNSYFRQQSFVPPTALNSSFSRAGTNFPSSTPEEITTRDSNNGSRR
ncbi:hypothetical protein ACLMJK_005786 [Lecanora helva]